MCRVRKGDDFARENLAAVHGNGFKGGGFSTDGLKPQLNLHAGGLNVLIEGGDKGGADVVRLRRKTGTIRINQCADIAGGYFDGARLLQKGPHRPPQFGAPRPNRRFSAPEPCPEGFFQ